MERICKNQDCKKLYFVDEKNVDDGFCSFLCWEKENCKLPEIPEYEEIKINEL